MMREMKKLMLVLKKRPEGRDRNRIEFDAYAMSVNVRRKPIGQKHTGEIDATFNVRFDQEYPAEELIPYAFHAKFGNHFIRVMEITYEPNKVQPGEELRPLPGSAVVRIKGEYEDVSTQDTEAE